MPLKLLIVYLKRFSGRHVCRAPWISGSLVLIVALGVGVFFSVRLANRAAVAGFQLFTQSISGGSDFVVYGIGGSLSVDKLSELRKALNPLPVHLLPVVEGTATLPGTGQASDDFDAEQVPVISIDLLAARNLIYARPKGSYSIPDTDGGPGGSSSVFATRALAVRLGIERDDSIEVIIGDRPQPLHISGVLVPAEFQAGKEDELLIMDLPVLQHLLSQPSRVDRVEVVIPDGSNAKAVRAQTQERLARLPRDTWQWSTTESERRSAQTMTAAFRLNLSILSGLSLLVGLYLVIQAMEAAVVRRRTEIGILLSMGFEPGWIRMAWLLESLTLGLVGSVLGLVLGWGMAQGSVRAVAQTVNSLYVNTTASAAGWDSGEALLAFALGLVATVSAGWLPARDAAATLPVHVMRKESRSEGIRLLDAPWLGGALLILGLLLSFLPPWSLGAGVRFPLAGYLAALCWLVGAAVLASRLLVLVPRLFRRRMHRSALWRVAASQFRHSSGRQKLTVAGLVVAVGMAAGMEILTYSFERTVTTWIEHSLKADLFVAVKGIESASSRNKMSEDTWRALAADPAVQDVEIGHHFQIRLKGKPTMLRGIRSRALWSDRHLIWVARPTKSVVLDRPLADGDWPALVSESFSIRYNLGRDDRFELPTPSGMKPVHIMGVYADYGHERGTLLMDGSAVCEWFRDRRAVNLAASLRKGLSPDEVQKRWTRQYPGLAIRTNRTLREEVLMIFHQTFAVTHVLTAIGVTVAVCGLALALFSLLLDRRTELVTLRELGFSRRSIANAVAIEGSVMSAIGLVGGLLLSLALGWLLIYVINRQSFGWTLAFAIPPGGLALLAAGVLLAAVCTSLGVGYWASRLKGEQHE